MTKKEQILSTLSLEQEMFAHHFLETLNIATAFSRIGLPKDTDFSQFAAGTRLLKYIELLKKERREHTLISSNEIRAELVALAFTDIRDYFNEDLSLKPLSSIPNTKAIKKISTKAIRNKSGEEIGRTIELEMYNKMQALETLAKHTLFYSDNALRDTGGETVKGNSGMRAVNINHRRPSEPQNRSDEGKDKPNGK